jgi:hypothetical protein
MNKLVLLLFGQLDRKEKRNLKFKFLNLPTKSLTIQGGQKSQVDQPGST